MDPEIPERRKEVIFFCMLMSKYSKEYKGIFFCSPMSKYSFKRTGGAVMNLGKVIVFSILISANMIVWHEALGMEFVYGIAIFTAYVALWPYKRR